MLEGGSKSEDTGKILRLPTQISQITILSRKLGRFLGPSKDISAEKVDKLVTVLGGKFKFSAQDSDLEYSCWRCKNFPVSSDSKPPLGFLTQF